MAEPPAISDELRTQLPATHDILLSANLTVHPSVTRVVLSGSRGLAGGYRPDSDVDLTLVVDAGGLPVGAELAALLQAVLDTTLRNWHGPVEADLAAVFDSRNCGLRCFAEKDFSEGSCPEGGTDCFGIYKVQKGFSGFVPPFGVQVVKMHPCITVWEA